MMQFGQGYRTPAKWAGAFPSKLQSATIEPTPAKCRGTVTQDTECFVASLADAGDEDALARPLRMVPLRTTRLVSESGARKKSRWTRRDADEFEAVEVNGDIARLDDNAALAGKRR
jgi:hypothetical protein